MIWHIAKKEFVLNLLSPKLMLSLLLCIFIIPITVYFNVNEFKRKTNVYNIEQKRIKEDVNKAKVFAHYKPEIIRPLNPLSIFSHGIQNNIGTIVKIKFSEIPHKTEGNIQERDNPLLASFSNLDFVSILLIVFSLIAIIFSFDTCSGEKKTGTLKLQLSSSLSKAKILLGKIIGIYLTLLPLLLFCFLLSFIIISFHPFIKFSFNEWRNLFLLFLLTIIYFSIFVTVGLLVSTKFESSTSSIFVCLVVWVTLIFLIPNLGYYIANTYTNSLNKDITYQLKEIEEEFNDEFFNYTKFSKYFGNCDYDMSDMTDGKGEGIEMVSNTTKSYLEACREFYSEVNLGIFDLADKKWKLQKEQIDFYKYQYNINQAFSYFSPSEIFRDCADALCHTDVGSYNYFIEEAKKYRKNLISYYINDGIFNSFIYFTPIPEDKFVTANQIVFKASNGLFKTYNDAVNNGHEDIIEKAIYKEKLFPELNSENYKPLDFSDVPKFKMNDIKILYTIKMIIIKIMILIMINIILFYLAYISFIRFDIR